MSAHGDKRDDDSALAAEYALGLLSADARAAFEARLADEPDLRRLYVAWVERLALLADEIAPVAPTARVRRKVMARIAPPRRRGWLWGLVSGGLVAACLAVLAIGVRDVMTPPPGAFSPAYVAELSAKDGSLVVRASYDAGARQLRVVRAQGNAPPGRALELWLIAGDAAPVSLGVLPQDRTATLSLQTAQAERMKGATLAISSEPPGGSPTGQPTGPVLAAGKVSGA